MPKPVLIDTDTGVDDALALIFALRSPELSVRAITTVAGNVSVKNCTQNVLRILSLLQLREPPLVAEGAKKPLRRRLFIAPEVHGRDGLGNVSASLIRKPTVGVVPQAASELIVECCRKFGKRLTIIAIGPLTNLALALKKNPAALSNVGRIISMGGAFRVPGNTGPVAEFNYYVDPEAARVVLNSGLPVTVIPLDVTEHVVLMRREVEYRAARRASPAANAIFRFTKFYMRYHRKTEGFNGGYMHDPLVIAAAVNPGLFDTRKVHVDVETSGVFTRGMTVADFRKKVRQEEHAVNVAVKIDRERFFKLFHERVWG